MARKLRNNFNIDLLRICYKQPEGFFEFLAETQPNSKIPRDGYYLFVVGDDDVESQKSVVCNVVADDGTEIGTLVANSYNSKYGQLCFLSLCNKSLYDAISCDPNGNKGSMVHCLDFVIDDLGLQFVSVTELHIAMDTNYNVPAKIIRYKHDCSHYDMIVNRKRVEGNKEKIRGYKEVCQSSRKRRENPTIYIEQKKEYAPQLCLYNKTIEIKEASGKQYVTDWNDFGNQTIYRSELRLRWDYIKEYFEGKGIHGYDIFLAILRRDVLEQMFEHFSTRLIYFRNKHTDEVISVHNIA